MGIFQPQREPNSLDKIKNKMLANLIMECATGISLRPQQIPAPKFTLHLLKNQATRRNQCPLQHPAVQKTSSPKL